MAPILNQIQSVFSLSMLSNLAGSRLGTVAELEAYMAPVLDDTLACGAPYFGEWKVVWGPAIYQAAKSDVADNTMYVAQNQNNTSQLMISVAGTNPVSFYGWFFEDFNVFKTQKWTTGNPPAGSDPKISQGTYDGLSILQNLIPSPSQPGAGLNLQDFLKQIVAGMSGSVQIMCAGHSLGGALSPTLALWLSDTQAAWAGGKAVSFHCQPSAGPTPGNKDFAAYYDSVMGANTIRIHNALDVIPHAWQESDLAQISSLYEPVLAPNTTIDALVDIAKVLSFGKRYTQINESAPALPGTFYFPNLNPCNKSLSNWIEQLGYQHVDAYYDLLQVPRFLELTKTDQERKDAENVLIEIEKILVNILENHQSKK